MGRRREALRRETGVGAYQKAVSNSLELCGARSRGLRLLSGTVSKRLSGFLEFARLIKGCGGWVELILTSHLLCCPHASLLGRPCFRINQQARPWSRMRKTPKSDNKWVLGV